MVHALLTFMYCKRDVRLKEHLTNRTYVIIEVKLITLVYLKNSLIEFKSFFYHFWFIHFISISGLYIIYIIKYIIYTYSTEQSPS